jgi:hypothetical protein
MFFSTAKSDIFWLVERVRSLPRHVAFILPDQILHDGQLQPGVATVEFRGEEKLKDAPYLILGNANPCILH